MEVDRRWRAWVAWGRRLTHACLPSECLLCGGPASGEVPNLCRSCAGELLRNDPCCPVCALPFGQAVGHSGLCRACSRRPPPFVRVVAPFLYTGGIRDLVIRLKFRGELAAARTLGALLVEHVPARGETAPRAILPVPLHPARLRGRGFNQAVEIARPLARALHRPLLAHEVERRRATAPQSELDTALARRRNVRGAFRVGGRVARLRDVAIVDDVMTSGATLGEMARALRRAGIERVSVWVCARAE